MGACATPHVGRLGACIPLDLPCLHNGKSQRTRDLLGLRVCGSGVGDGDRPNARGSYPSQRQEAKGERQLAPSRSLVSPRFASASGCGASYGRVAGFPLGWNSLYSQHSREPCQSLQSGTAGLRVDRHTALGKRALRWAAYVEVLHGLGGRAPRCLRPCVSPAREGDVVLESPNPSIDRTSRRPLRALDAAAHV